MTDPAARRFEGKVVLITGAAGGIGHATAVRFAAEGARRGLVDRARDGRGQREGRLARHPLETGASPANPAAFHERMAGTIPLRRYGQPGGSRGAGGVPLQRGRGLHHRRDLHGGRRLDGPSHSARAARGHEPRSPTPGFSAAGTGQTSAAAVSSFWSAGITSLAKKRRLRSASSYGMPA